MHAHERFEEMAGLAAVGELSPEEWQEFSEHRVRCAQCRAAVCAFAPVAAAAFQYGAPDDEDGERRKQRARAAVSRHISIAERVLRGQARRPSWIAARVAIAAMLIAVGVLVGIHLTANTARQESASEIPVSVAKPVAETEIADARAELERYRQLVAALRQDASRQTGENAHLRDLLTGAEQRGSTLDAAIQAANQKLTDQSQQLSKTTGDLAAARTQLSEAQSISTANLNANVELRYKLVEAEAKLRETSDSLDRERQLLSADREIREIMGARDVHIVDVFDIDGKGRTKRPFGRAFYTQGKSLIFYAFDLPIPKSDKGEFAYYAWGRNSTAGHRLTHRLGIFYNDDRAQHRWTMKFDDPKVLAEIDTVFVTLEPSLHGQVSPTGKPILDAYFGTPPNHP